MGCPRINASTRRRCCHHGCSGFQDCGKSPWLRLLHLRITNFIGVCKLQTIESLLSEEVGIKPATCWSKLICEDYMERWDLRYGVIWDLYSTTLWELQFLFSQWCFFMWAYAIQLAWLHAVSLGLACKHVLKKFNYLRLLHLSTSKLVVFWNDWYIYI